MARCSLALFLSFSPSLYLPTPAPNHSVLFLLSYFFFFFAPVFLILPRPACPDADFFFNLLFLGKRFRSRFFSTRKTAGSPRQKIAGTIRSPPRLCAQPGAREEDREPKPASQF